MRHSKIYSADFVTVEEGTGIVHTAVMYGADDFALGQDKGLPRVHLVNPNGKFIEGTAFLEGRFVRDEDVAVDIIKDLAHRGHLFSKEKYTHSYPFCWRCKTALIYYAARFMVHRDEHTQRLTSCSKPYDKLETKAFT